MEVAAIVALIIFLYWREEQSDESVDSEDV